MLKLVVLKFKVATTYLLILTSGNGTPTIHKTYDTWWECEQARIRVQQVSAMTGACRAIPVDTKERDAGK